MAEFDYAGAAATARRLIEKFGSDVSFSRTTQGSIDPATGEETTPSTEAIQGKSTPLLNYSSFEINNTSITEGDAYIYFDGEQLKNGDTVDLNNKTYRVYNTQNLTSLDGAIVYQKVQLKQ